MAKKTEKCMTVKKAIALLSKVEDKNMAMMVDCPHCGKGNQLAMIHEVVVLKGGHDDVDA